MRRKQGFPVDRAGFESEMENQRQRARAARQDVDSMHVQSGVLGEIHEASEFVGYGQLTADATVVSLLKEGTLSEQASEGEEIQFILDRTPFYAESGGQVADKGTISGDAFVADVKDVQKAPNGQNLHTAVIRSGEMTKGAKVRAEVDQDARKLTIRNHTATHLLHRALKQVLGEHVNQAGSYVGPDRLRFDFSHFGQVTKEELEKIEQIVNEQIWADISVDIAQKSIEEAKKMGAMALFGEKYGDVVRVVSVGDYSLELCGGCHVQSTSIIGLFKLVFREWNRCGDTKNRSSYGARSLPFVQGRGSHAYQCGKSTEIELERPRYENWVCSL